MRSYSEQLGKWMEVGNSGMFRPEMLRPMGLPEDVNVIAWGLSLERPTMILYGIDNIRDLFGHKVRVRSGEWGQGLGVHFMVGAATRVRKHVILLRDSIVEPRGSLILWSFRAACNVSSGSERAWGCSRHIAPARVPVLP